jgi:hypothetical protein
LLGDGGENTKRYYAHNFHFLINEMAVIKGRTGPLKWRGAKSEEICALEWKK